ncbi:hypothetical protein CDD83_5514 [Cordyceps sp. RAO-2017]|nr:hypothetical protein CDD83_5514 [Cordyceps sp. RAO-2017]
MARLLHSAKAARALNGKFQALRLMHATTKLQSVKTGHTSKAEGAATALQATRLTHVTKAEAAANPNKDKTGKGGPWATKNINQATERDGRQRSIREAMRRGQTKSDLFKYGNNRERGAEKWPAAKGPLRETKAGEAEERMRVREERERKKQRMEKEAERRGEEEEKRREGLARKASKQLVLGWKVQKYEARRLKKLAKEERRQAKMARRKEERAANEAAGISPKAARRMKKREMARAKAARKTAREEAEQQARAAREQALTSFEPRRSFEPPSGLPKAHFAGHHAAGLEKMKALMPSISVVVECRDARLPLSTRNPMLDRLAEGKRRLLVFTKRR